jgi:glyoxylate/hydroxypyruvate reductase A
MKVLYRSDVARGPAWQKLFAQLAPDVDFRVWPDAGNLDEIEYLIAWQVPADFIAALPRLKVLFSSGAGVDHIDTSAVPAHVAIVRMVEPGIINGMLEYVTMSVLALHRHLFDYQDFQRQGLWQPIEVYPPSTCSVGVMGVGRAGPGGVGAPWRFRIPAAGLEAITQGIARRALLRWRRDSERVPGSVRHPDLPAASD